MNTRGNFNLFKDKMLIEEEYKMLREEEYEEIERKEGWASYFKSPDHRRRFYHQAHIMTIGLLYGDIKEEEKKLKETLERINTRVIKDELKSLKSIVVVDDEKVFKDIQCSYIVEHALNSLNKPYEEYRNNLMNKISLKYKEAIKSLEDKSVDFSECVEKVREFEELVGIFCTKKEINKDERIMST